MARFISLNNCSTKEDLKDFLLNDFRFSEKLSKNDEFVFVLGGDNEGSEKKRKDSDDELQDENPKPRKKRRLKK